MVNKLWYVIFLSAVLVVSASVSAVDKIAVINVNIIFQQLPERLKIIKKLENEFNKRSNELQKEEHNIRIKIQKLQQNISNIKYSERKRLEKEISKQRETFSNKLQSFEHDQRVRQIEERNKLLKRIRDAIKKVAEKEGYNIVIDSNAIAYVTNVKDITNDVLKQVK